MESYVGRALNPDRTYGLQCMDVAVQFVKDICAITGDDFKLEKNARDSLDPKINPLPKTFTIHKNTPEFLPRKTDIAVYTLGTFNNKFGHIALMYDNITLQTADFLEQNWDGNANTPCRIRKGWHYYGVSHFIRINYVE